MINFPNVNLNSISINFNPFQESASRTTLIVNVAAAIFLGIVSFHTFRFLVNFAIKKTHPIQDKAANHVKKVVTSILHPSLLKEEGKWPCDAVSKIMTTPQIKESFAVFLKELESEIFPFYEAHERGFDRSSIHGRMHIARAVIFCEMMARYLHSKGKIVDFAFVRHLTGLHDAGREGNGPDLWEEESATLLYQHLQRKGMPEQEAHQKSQLIIKDKQDRTSLEFQIFQSADCLDIMRECTGHGGRRGFQERFLTFLQDSNPQSEDFKFRQALIEEAWELIQMTEAKKHTDFKDSVGFMDKLLGMIERDRKKFKILASIL